MASERYDIYFSGRRTAGEAESVVRERLGRRLRIDAQQVALLFAGGTILVKRNVDLDTAAQYRVLFREAGAIVDIKETSMSARAGSQHRDSPPAGDPPVQSEETRRARGGVTEPASVMTLAEPRSGSLIDCAKPIAPAELPDISGLSVAGDYDPVGDRGTVPPPQINADGLSLLPPRTGDLRDCAKRPEPGRLPDISGMKLEEDV